MGGSEATYRQRSQGGDHRSHGLEAHAVELVSLARDTDMTLAELVDYIRESHGLEVALSGFSAYGTKFGC